MFYWVLSTIGFISQQRNPRFCYCQCKIIIIIRRRICSLASKYYFLICLFLAQLNDSLIVTIRTDMTIAVLIIRISCFGPYLGWVEPHFDLFVLFDRENNSNSTNSQSIIWTRKIHPEPSFLPPRALALLQNPPTTAGSPDATFLLVGFISQVYYNTVEFSHCFTSCKYLVKGVDVCLITTGSNISQKLRV